MSSLVGSVASHMSGRLRRAIRRWPPRVRGTRGWNAGGVGGYRAGRHQGIEAAARQHSSSKAARLKFAKAVVTRGSMVAYPVTMAKSRGLVDVVHWLNGCSSGVSLAHLATPKLEGFSCHRRRPGHLASRSRSWSAASEVGWFNGHSKVGLVWLPPSVWGFSRHGSQARHG